MSLEPASACATVKLQLPPFSTLRGKIIVNAPLGGDAAIEASSETSKVSVRIAPDGNYAFERLGPGTYQIRVVVEDGAGVVVEDGAGALSPSLAQARRARGARFRRARRRIRIVTDTLPRRGSARAVHGIELRCDGAPDAPPILIRADLKGNINVPKIACARYRWTAQPPGGGWVYESPDILDIQPKIAGERTLDVPMVEGRVEFVDARGPRSRRIYYSSSSDREHRPAKVNVSRSPERFFTLRLPPCGVSFSAGIYVATAPVDWSRNLPNPVRVVVARAKN